MIKMFETILTGWFLINGTMMDNNLHYYELFDGQKNTYISAIVDKPFPKENLSCTDDMCHVKLKIEAECFKEKSYPIANSKMALITTVCTAQRVTYLLCTERNSFVVGGRRYC